MRNGFRLGRIFGINIYIDWSWIFIFLLVTWNLAGFLFPSIHPNWSLALDVGVGLAASILFFASVLAHELAHSLVAVSRGLPVRSITLFIFGGVSNIEREPPSPGTEFLVSIVGPLTSIVLGILFLYLGRLNLGAFALTLSGSSVALSRLDPLTTLLLWLGPINILLGIFNLIPGFPLDGGRVLRSIFWAATNNLRRATLWATTVGHIIAWLFIIGGIAMAFGINIPFFGTGLLSGIWLAFIGWFLNNAASQSYRQVVVEDMLEGVPVSRLMRSDIPSVTPDIPISNLVYDHIMGTDEKSFPVLQDNQLVGLVCLDDVRKIPRDQWDTTRVNQIMTPTSKLTMVTPREDATNAFNKLSSQDVNQMPVVQDGQLVGMLRRRDILRWLQMQSRGTA